MLTVILVRCHKSIGMEVDKMDLNNILILRDIINLGAVKLPEIKKMHKIVFIIQEFTNYFNPPLNINGIIMEYIQMN